MPVQEEWSTKGNGKQKKGKSKGKGKDPTKQKSGKGKGSGQGNASRPAQGGGGDPLNKVLSKMQAMEAKFNKFMSATKPSEGWTCTKCGTQRNWQSRGDCRKCGAAKVPDPAGPSPVKSPVAGDATDTEMASEEEEEPEVALSHWESVLRHAKAMPEGRTKAALLVQAEAEVATYKKKAQEAKPLEARVHSATSRVAHLKKVLQERQSKEAELHKQFKEAETASKEAAEQLAEAEKELRSVTASQWENLALGQAGASTQSGVLEIATKVAQVLLQMQAAGIKDPTPEVLATEMAKAMVGAVTPVASETPEQKAAREQMEAAAAAAAAHRLQEEQQAASLQQAALLAMQSTRRQPKSRSRSRERGVQA